MYRNSVSSKYTFNFIATLRCGFIFFFFEVQKEDTAMSLKKAAASWIVCGL